MSVWYRWKSNSLFSVLVRLLAKSITSVRKSKVLIYFKSNPWNYFLQIGLGVCVCVCFRVVDSSSANNKLCIITTFDFGRAGSISDRVLHCVSVLTPSVQAPLDPIAMKHVWTQAYKHRFGLMAVWSYIKGITTITITAFHPLQQFPFLPPGTQAAIF